LGLSEDGKTCVACARAKAAKSIDWNARFNELEKLCDRHRKHDGSPDVIVPVSGGKDSHYQVWLLRRLGMHPLLVTVRDCFGGTEAGAHNLANLEQLACGLITWRQNPVTMKKMAREAFERYACPTWPIDMAIYAVPPRIAAQHKIPLIVYGENISWTYGGSGAKDEPSAMAQIHNDVVRPLDIEVDDESRIALRPYDGQDIEPVYLSYYTPWDGRKNYELAKSIGFRDANEEWDRDGCCENYDQIDSKGYMVHPMLKWVKFGAARVSDVASNWIRNGYITREAGVDLVREREGYIDLTAIEDFCETLGYSSAEFTDIVERHRNPHLFQREGNGYSSLHRYFQIAKEGGQA
jgi:N-acetyl sugar amidotransferase